MRPCSCTGLAHCQTTTGYSFLSSDSNLNGFKRPPASIPGALPMCSSRAIGCAPSFTRLGDVVEHPDEGPEGTARCEICDTEGHRLRPVPRSVNEVSWFGISSPRSVERILGKARRQPFALAGGGLGADSSNRGLRVWSAEYAHQRIGFDRAAFGQIECGKRLTCRRRYTREWVT
jgi:hypothetical protein